MNNEKNRRFLVPHKTEVFRGRKGISALLETVLLILVVLAAAGIIFGAVIPMLREPAERASMCQDALTVSSTPTMVTLVKNKEVTISSIAINVYDAAGAATGVSPANVSIPLSVGSAATSILPTTGGPFVKVQVIPVVNMTTGKQVACAPIEVLL